MCNAIPISHTKSHHHHHHLPSSQLAPPSEDVDVMDVHNRCQTKAEHDTSDFNDQCVKSVPDKHEIQIVQVDFSDGKLTNSIDHIEHNVEVADFQTVLKEEPVHKMEVFLDKSVSPENTNQDQQNLVQFSNTHIDHQLSIEHATRLGPTHAHEEVELNTSFTPAVHEQSAPISTYEKMEDELVCTEDTHEEAHISSALPLEEQGKKDSDVIDLTVENRGTENAILKNELELVNGDEMLKEEVVVVKSEMQLENSHSTAGSATIVKTEPVLQDEVTETQRGDMEVDVASSSKTTERLETISPVKEELSVKEAGEMHAEEVTEIVEPQLVQPVCPSDGDEMMDEIPERAAESEEMEVTGVEAVEAHIDGTVQEAMENCKVYGGTGDHSSAYDLAECAKSSKAQIYPTGYLRHSARIAPLDSPQPAMGAALSSKRSAEQHAPLAPQPIPKSPVRQLVAVFHPLVQSDPVGKSSPFPDIRPSAPRTLAFNPFSCSRPSPEHSPTLECTTPPKVAPEPKSACQGPCNPSDTTPPALAASKLSEPVLVPTCGEGGNTDDEEICADTAAPPSPPATISPLNRDLVPPRAKLECVVVDVNVTDDHEANGHAADGSHAAACADEASVALIASGIDEAPEHIAMDTCPASGDASGEIACPSADSPDYSATAAVEEATTVPADEGMEVTPAADVSALAKGSVEEVPGDIAPEVTSTSECVPAEPACGPANSHVSPATILEATTATADASMETAPAADATYPPTDGADVFATCAGDAEATVPADAHIEVTPTSDETALTHVGEEEAPVDNALGVISTSDGTSGEAACAPANAADGPATATVAEGATSPGEAVTSSAPAANAYAGTSNNGVRTVKEEALLETDLEVAPVSGDAGSCLVDAADGTETADVGEATTMPADEVMEKYPAVDRTAPAETGAEGAFVGSAMDATPVSNGVSGEAVCSPANIAADDPVTALVEEETTSPPAITVITPAVNQNAGGACNRDHIVKEEAFVEMDLEITPVFTSDRTPCPQVSEQASIIHEELPAQTDMEIIPMSTKEIDAPTDPNTSGNAKSIPKIADVEETPDANESAGHPDETCTATEAAAAIHADASTPIANNGTLATTFDVAENAEVQDAWADTVSEEMVGKPATVATLPENAAASSTAEDVKVVMGVETVTKVESAIVAQTDGEIAAALLSSHAQTEEDVVMEDCHEPEVMDLSNVRRAVETPTVTKMPIAALESAASGTKAPTAVMADGAGYEDRTDDAMVVDEVVPTAEPYDRMQDIPLVKECTTPEARGMVGMRKERTGIQLSDAGSVEKMGRVGEVKKKRAPLQVVTNPSVNFGISASSTQDAGQKRKVGTERYKVQAVKVKKRTRCEETEKVQKVKVAKKRKKKSGDADVVVVDGMQQDRARHPTNEAVDAMRRWTQRAGGRVQRVNVRRTRGR